MAAADDQPKGTLPLHWLVALYVAALAVNVYVFWVLPSASTLERLAFSLQLIGIYNLGLTFLGQTNLLKTFPSWLEGMTSANLSDFSGATFRTVAVFAFLSSLAVQGFPPPRVTGRLPLLLRALVLMTLGLVFVILVPILFVAVAVFLLLGIAPVAYIGYVLVGVLLDAISSAPNDFQLSSPEGSIGLKATVRAHHVQLRTLLVGVPATALGVATAGYALLT
jgi:hypothetical protein